MGIRWGKGFPFLSGVSLKNKFPLPFEVAQQAPLTGLSPAWQCWRGWLKRKAWILNQQRRDLEWVHPVSRELMCLVLQWLPTSLPISSHQAISQVRVTISFLSEFGEVPLHGRGRATIFSSFTSNILLMGYTILIILWQKQCFGGSWQRAEVSRGSSAGTNLAVPSLRIIQAPGQEHKLTDKGEAQIHVYSVPVFAENSQRN